MGDNLKLPYSTLVCNWPQPKCRHQLINREKDVTPDFEKMQPTRTTVLENRTAQKKKEEKKIRKMMIKRGKIEKTAETKCKFHGEELLGPGMKWIIQRTDRSDINEEY